MEGPQPRVVRYEAEGDPRVRVQEQGVSSGAEKGMVSVRAWWRFSLRRKFYLMGLVALKDDETKLPLPESMIQKVWPYDPKT